jgi:hypothetical protein
MDSSKDIFSVDRIRQLARVFSAIIILLTILIAVGHIFGDEPVVEDYPPIENLMPIILGLSVAGLGIAWRWEGIGSALSIIFFLAHLGLFQAVRGEFFPLGILAVFMPIPITAFLFLWCWLRSHE